MVFCHFRCSMHIQQFVNISSTNSFFFYQAGLPRVLCDDPQQEGSPKMIPRKNAQKAQKLFLEKMPKTPKNYSCSSKFMLDSFTSREEATPRMGWFSNIQSHQIVVIFLQFWGKKKSTKKWTNEEKFQPHKVHGCLIYIHTYVLHNYIRSMDAMMVQARLNENFLFFP